MTRIASDVRSVDRLVSSQRDILAGLEDSSPNRRLPEGRTVSD
jgi:hypothetical protein